MDGCDAGTHASGRAGQHFELFGSILDRVKKVTTNNHSLRVQYVRQCQEFDNIDFLTIITMYYY